MERNLSRALDQGEFLLADRQVGKAQAIILPEERKHRLAKFPRRSPKVGQVDELRGVGNRCVRAEVTDVAELPRGELDGGIAGMLWGAKIALAFPREPQRSPRVGATTSW